MNGITVGNYMTESPHTINAEQPLSAAQRLMKEERIRHLPVLRGSELVGILTSRDLAIAESLRAEARVSDVMMPDPYAISPNTSLEWVAVDMAEHKYGSVVVVDKGK